jgi:hypothetical protein
MWMSASAWGCLITWVASVIRPCDARKLLAEIDDSRADDFYERLDLDLIRRYLQQDLFFKTVENHGELQRRRKPDGVDGISAGIFQLFVNDERESADRLADILSRLRQAPAYLEAELAVLSTPVKRWRDIGRKSRSSLPASWPGPGKRNIRTSQHWSARLPR